MFSRIGFLSIRNFSAPRWCRPHFSSKFFERSARNMSSNKMKIIIDTDPGFDDAMAIAIALTWPNTDVLAMTCVNGNVSIENTCMNTLKLRKLFNREDVPVYKGARTSLLNDRNHESSHIHGDDGLLGCGDQIKVDESQLEKQHAANCIIDLATKHKGEISIVALGPLTNLALAVRLQPDLPSLLKDVIILGGNYTGLGNQTPSAEFNFAVDPVAAHIVLNGFSCPVIVVPWETVIQTPLSEAFKVEYGNKDNDRSRFFNCLVKQCLNRLQRTKFCTADPLAMCVALNRESVVMDESELHATVEVFGEYTHGMMVVDRRDCKGTQWSKPNITLVTKVNMSTVESMLIHSVS